MLRVGVVGVGHLGKHHARIFNNMKDIKLIGIFDQDKQKAEKIAEKHSVEIFKTYDTMLDSVDAVDIAATTTAHYELAKKAIEKKIHVFVEKPITSKLEQAKELIKLAETNNVKIQVGHIERFNPVVLKVASEIKEPLFIESHRIAPFTPRGSDVPVVLDLMIHDIDLILSFVKSKIIDINASGVSLLTPSIDIANARLEFENGAIANVTSSRISLKKERKLRFFQKDAYLSLDFNAKKVNIVKKSGDLKKIMPAILSGNMDFSVDDILNVKKIIADDLKKDALTLELESFRDSIVNDTPPKVDGIAGTRALDIATKIVSQINHKQNKFFNK
mgnify:CR=1 FL=1